MPKVAYLPSMEVEKKEDDIPEVMDPNSEYFRSVFGINKADNSAIGAE